MIQPWQTDPKAVAYEFITAGGMNSPEQVDSFISEGSPEQVAEAFAQEAFEMWVMHVDRAAFKTACLEFMQTRPDRTNTGA